KTDRHSLGSPCANPSISRSGPPMNGEPVRWRIVMVPEAAPGRRSSETERPPDGHRLPGPAIPGRPDLICRRRHASSAGPASGDTATALHAGQDLIEGDEAIQVLRLDPDPELLLHQGHERHGGQRIPARDRLRARPLEILGG